MAAAASLLAASLVTACSQLTQTLTVDFVYVACTKAAGANNYGEINVYEINSESGRMRQIPSSPFPSQGRNPVAEAVSLDYGSLFVVNQDDNTIVQFGIGTDGKLYPYNTVNTPGIFPLGHRREQIKPVHRRSLPAAAHLFGRRAVLRFHRRLSAFAQPAAPRRVAIGTPATNPPSMASTGLWLSPARTHRTSSCPRR